MGESSTELPDPELYLRKYTGGGAGSGRRRAPGAPGTGRSRSARTYREMRGSTTETTCKPPVPKNTDHVPKPFKSCKNIIHWNAFNQMRSSPTKPQEIKIVDQPSGNVQLAEKAGLVPKYVNKKDYGRTPEYLNRFKGDAEAEARRWEAEMAENQRRKESMKLSEEERQQILQGLRCNWSLVNQTYQGLSLLTDTLNKKQRKTRVENQLKQLEKFIQILEKHQIIFIADNPYALL